MSTFPNWDDDPSPRTYLKTTANPRGIQILTVLFNETIQRSFTV